MIRNNMPKPLGKFPEVKVVHGIGITLNVSIESLLFRLQNREEDWADKEEYNHDKFYGLFPEFQRDQVWSLEQKQQLIYSILSGIPIGNFFVNETFVESLSRPGNPDEKSMYRLNDVLYDGMQRFLAILEFLSGDFEITWGGYTGTIIDFQPSLRRHIIRYSISLIQTDFADWNELIDYYILINKGGIAHTDEDFKKALDAKI